VFNYENVKLCEHLTNIEKVCDCEASITEVIFHYFRLNYMFWV